MKKPIFREILMRVIKIKWSWSVDESLVNGIDVICVMPQNLLNIGLTLTSWWCGVLWTVTPMDSSPSDESSDESPVNGIDLI